MKTTVESPRRKRSRPRKRRVVTPLHPMTYGEHRKAFKGA